MRFCFWGEWRNHQRKVIFGLRLGSVLFIIFWGAVFARGYWNLKRWCFGGPCVQTNGDWLATGSGSFGCGLAGVNLSPIDANSVRSMASTKDGIRPANNGRSSTE